MTSPRPTPLQVLLPLAALGVHVAACSWLGYLPPNRVFEVLVTALPTLLAVVAVAAAVVRPGERRPLQAAALLEWLLVLFALPANFVGLLFAPAAALLSVALSRPRTRSTAGSDEAG